MRYWHILGHGQAEAPLRVALRHQGDQEVEVTAGAIRCQVELRGRRRLLHHDEVLDDVLVLIVAVGLSTSHGGRVPRLVVRALGQAAAQDALVELGGVVPLDSTLRLFPH